MPAELLSIDTDWTVRKGEGKAAKHVSFRRGSGGAGEMTVIRYIYTNDLIWLGHGLKWFRTMKARCLHGSRRAIGRTMKASILRRPGIGHVGDGADAKLESVAVRCPIVLARRAGRATATCTNIIRLRSRGNRLMAITGAVPAELLSP